MVAKESSWISAHCGFLHTGVMPTTYNAAMLFEVYPEASKVKPHNVVPHM